jgi:hypothetical protein
MRYVNGSRLDSRVIREDFDPGFEEGRQYGRGKRGCQVRLCIYIYIYVFLYIPGMCVRMCVRACPRAWHVQTNQSCSDESTAARRKERRAPSQQLSRLGGAWPRRAWRRIWGRVWRARWWPWGRGLWRRAWGRARRWPRRVWRRWQRQRQRLRRCVCAGESVYVSRLVPPVYPKHLTLGRARLTAADRHKRPRRD